MKINDAIIPSINNIQRSDYPMPKYQIVQMGMGRCYAENLITKEIVKLENVGYYYEVVSGRMKIHDENIFRMEGTK